MAEKKAKYYKLSERKLNGGIIKKIIIIDDTVKPTDIDLADVKMYVSCGYTIQHKSQSRAAAARKRAKETGFGKNNNKKADKE
ncbi:hypothetical protein J6Q66_09640 [bacterium]|nr:hypothetical protein [bacterium]